jgi:predicted dehydrogenase
MIKKVIRFFLMYGLTRTIVKVAGRNRLRYLSFFLPSIYISNKSKEISLIGCGQFGFSTISYFLLKNQGNKFLDCYDVDFERQETTARFWKYNSVDNINLLYNNSTCKFLYIASNHATHTYYALKALEKNLIVYLEKPISVNYEQLEILIKTISVRKGTVYVGYNRPFSAAIIQLKKHLPKNLPISLNCFVVGHKLEKDHWYRNLDEGTRICGNMGHWIDLGVHLLSERGFLPLLYKISVAYSSCEERDDNIAVSISTDFQDLVLIMISARDEPFEGINETINFQSGNLIAKIDDFQKMKIWKGTNSMKFSYSPKDVGHRKSINQPFEKKKRDFNEIIISTILMLEIKDMVNKGEIYRSVRPFDIKNNLLE